MASFVLSEDTNQALRQSFPETKYNPLIELTSKSSNKTRFWCSKRSLVIYSVLKLVKNPNGAHSFDPQNIS